MSGVPVCVRDGDLAAGEGRGLPRRTGADQRARLLDAIVAVVASDGYAASRVGDIAARAGVSRSTFYELFEDKQACFLAAHRRLAACVGDRLEQALGGCDPPAAPHLALAAVDRLARQQPEVLVFLTHEALLAGPAARREYDALLARLEDALGRSVGHAAHGQSAPALPWGALLGGAARLYCMQLRREGAVCEDSLAVLSRWAENSSRAAKGDGTASAHARTAPAGREAGRRWVPRALPRGRHRMDRQAVETIQRERIAYAATLATMHRDGESVAVADIVAAAGVSREVFYAHYADKEQAFLAAQQLVFEQLIAVASGAFFLPDNPWGERVWNAAGAAAGLLAANPSFAHFAFVAAYGTGERGVRRCDEALLAFGLFLEHGYRAHPQGAGLPRLTSDAIALCVMEAAAREVRAGRAAELPALVPGVVYCALAPFVGVHAAGELVKRRLRG